MDSAVATTEEIQQQEPLALGLPSLRFDDLPSNATRWEKIGAAGSDHDLVIQWWILGSVSLLSTLIVSVVLASVLFYKKVRRSPFNQYLVGLMIPDIVFSGNCVYACWMSAVVGHFYSPAMCEWQSWFLTFGVTANAWMNLVIALEVYKMLRHSQQGIRYFPPKRRTVQWQSLAVYVYATLVASIVLFPKDDSKFPLKINSYSGYYCMPGEYNVASSLFFFLVFLPLTAGIPMTVAGYIFYDIYVKSDLMPKNGRGRLLAIYFLRIIIVFFVWWLPAIVLSLLITGMNPWYQWGVGSMFAHTQGAASACLSLLKPDVKQAVLSFLHCCQPFQPPHLSITGTQLSPTLMGPSSSTSFSSRNFLQRFLRSGRTSNVPNMDNSNQNNGNSIHQRSHGRRSRCSSAHPEVLPSTHSSQPSATHQQVASWYDVTELEMEEGIYLGDGDEGGGDLNLTLTEEPENYSGKGTEKKENDEETGSNQSQENELQDLEQADVVNAEKDVVSAGKLNDATTGHLQEQQHDEESDDG